jgi:hypothetical protein
LASFAPFTGAVGDRSQGEDPEMWKRIKFYTVSAVIVALGGTVVYLRFFAPREAVIRHVWDPPAIVQQIRQLHDLVTVKYTVQKVIGLEEQKVPFGSEKVSLLIQATVLAGVDLSEIGPHNVTVNPDHAVTIQLPVPKVMHVFVDEQQTKVWDRSKTWWTPWVPFNPELEQKARLSALEAVQATALQMGILRDAQRNTETTIRAFLATLGIESVSFQASATSAAVSQ